MAPPLFVLRRDRWPLRIDRVRTRSACVRTDAVSDDAAVRGRRVVANVAFLGAPARLCGR
jgi:hypothetical protein